MTLTIAEAAKVRGIIRNGSGAILMRAPYTGASLGGLFELVCGWHDAGPETMAGQTFVDFAKRFPAFATCRQNWEQAIAGESTFSPLVIDERSTQVFGLRKTEDYTGSSWAAFMMAFRRHLKAAGFDGNFSFALSKVFTELAQNVPDHSAENQSAQSPSLVGFHIRDGKAVFGVADVGRGILASLRTNPRWTDLQTASDAVEAVVQRQATCKTGYVAGAGFKETLQAFVDHNCELSLSTGTASAVIGQTSDGRQLNTTAVTDLPGVRVIAACFLRSKPLEQAI